MAKKDTAAQAPAKKKKNVAEAKPFTEAPRLKVKYNDEIALPCCSLIVLPPGIADIEEAFIYARNLVALVFWIVPEVGGDVCSCV